MSLRIRSHRDRPCEHRSIHGQRCLECGAQVRVPAWLHATAPIGPAR